MSNYLFSENKKSLSSINEFKVRSIIIISCSFNYISYSYVSTLVFITFTIYIIFFKENTASAVIGTRFTINFNILVNSGNANICNLFKMNIFKIILSKLSLIIKNKEKIFFY